jgi:hypothetical protein
MSAPCDSIWSLERGERLEIYNPLYSIMEAEFRLPGFDGAAFTLRTLAIPSTSPDQGRDQLAFDVGLLSPDRKVEYLMRPANPGFINRLAKFLWASANEFHPEQSVPSVSDESIGLTIAVVSSTDFRIELQITLIQELGANVQEFDLLNFETSRLALTTASRNVRALDGSQDFFNGGGESEV